MSKSQIISLGGNKFVYTKRWTWIGAFVFGVAFFFLMAYFYKHTTTTNIISIVPLVCVVVSFFYTLNKAGVKLWNQIKDKSEPIELK
jgi:cell division protein FtsW (lipid II flippase)